MKNKNLINKYYPDFKDVGYYFKNYLKVYLKPGVKLLDIGCGRQAFGEDYYKKAALKVGLDTDQKALAENKLMDEKIWADIENVSLKIGKFDVIIAQWVLEHISNPEKALKNINQLCQKNGYFIFMTPNLLSPLIFLSKIFPITLKKYLRKILLGIKEEDTHPTYYRLNTLSKIDRLLSQNSFQKIEVQKIGVQIYFSFNRYVLLVKKTYDRLSLQLNPNSPFKTHLVGVYKKVR